MTDGILLAEIQHDRMLRRYDTLIIDEAHERSLNIDFLLGYLKQLLPRRPDLKLIITRPRSTRSGSPEHFGGRPGHGGVRPDVPGGGPLPPARRATGSTRSRRSPPRWTSSACEVPGDVLVFLSGEREIRDTADALRRHLPDGTEVLPLYARLSAAEQHKVFAPHAGRRIVLATNVAETSLTVPGIRYVVDPGTARISRYSARTKVQRLPIERGLAGAARTSARAAAGVPPTASASGSTPRRTSSPGPGSPSRRCSGPTWPRSSCR